MGGGVGGKPSSGKVREVRCKLVGGTKRRGVRGLGGREEGRWGEGVREH